MPPLERGTGEGIGGIDHRGAYREIDIRGSLGDSGVDDLRGLVWQDRDLEWE